MKLSNKKSGELYTTVYEDVMSARLKIYRLLSGNLREDVDNILFKLITDAPKNAIQVFESKPKKKP